MADQPTPDERRFRALASSSVEHVAEIDSTGRVVYVSPDPRPGREARSLGFERVHPDDRAEVARTLTEVFATGESRGLSFRVAEPDGEVRWLDVTMTPFDAENDQRHALVVSRDVTEARRMEESLRETRERFQRVAENAYDMITEHDAAGRILYSNDRVWRVLGYENSGKILNAADLVHPEDRQRLVDAFRLVRDGRVESCQEVIRARRADGSWCWIDASVFSTGEGAGGRQLIIARDVSERVDAEQRLRDSERRYRRLVEKAPVGIVVVQDGKLVFANAAAAGMCGAGSEDDLTGVPMSELVGRQSLRDVSDLVARAGRGESQPDAFDVRVVGLDGRERHLVGVGTFTSYAGRPAFQCFVRDVSELEESRRDQERLALQLQEARKLESLGVLAGGIAHDFNNLLAVILSNVRYAKSQTATPGDRSEALADAEDATESAARLVKQLLAYAGRREPEVRDIDLSALARAMADLLSTALSGAVALHLDLQEDPLPVHADVVQLEQVLMNLVLNAADAVGEATGTVTVRTRRVPLVREQLAGWIGGELRTGEYACLEVEDTGVGMDAATRERIFEPFFTTKQEGHGLGLSAVLGLVQGHRGAISVSSEPGRGTRFRVALPVASGPLQPRGDDAGLVLLVDAEAGRRGATARILGDTGARALEASGDEQARDLLARHGEEIDAAVIDARPPAPSPRPLLGLLLASRPELPVLVLLDAEGDPGAEAGPSLILRSPFADEALRGRLSALLAKALSAG